MGVSAGNCRYFRDSTADRKEVTVKLLDANHFGCSAAPKTLTRILVIPALALFPLGGCSFAFVAGPSPRQSAERPCTTSYAAPTLDLLGVPTTFLLSFGFGGLERSLDAVEPDDDETFGNLEKVSLAASGALLASGVYGLVQVGRCRASQDRGGDPPLMPGHPDDPFRRVLAVPDDSVRLSDR